MDVPDPVPIQHTQACPPLEPYDASVDPWNAPDLAQPENVTGQGGADR